MNLQELMSIFVFDCRKCNMRCLFVFLPSKRLYTTPVESGLIGRRDIDQLCTQCSLQQLYVNCNLNDCTLVYLKILSLPTYISCCACQHPALLSYCPLQNSLPSILVHYNQRFSIPLTGLDSTQNLRMLLRHPSKKSAQPPNWQIFPHLAAPIFNGYSNRNRHLLT